MGQNKLKYLDSIQYLQYLKVINVSYNKISNIEVIEKLTMIELVDLSHNQIHYVVSLSHMSKLTVLYLSFNFVESVESLIDFNRHYNLELLVIKKTNSNLFSINRDNFLLMSKNKNNRIVRYNGNYVFIKSFNLITKDVISSSSDLTDDCQLVLDFLKKNVHLNLYSHEQAKDFIYKCKFIDLNF